MTALVGRLFLSVGRENGHELGLKTVSFIFKQIKVMTALMGRLSRSIGREKVMN